MPQRDEHFGALPLTVPDPFGLAADPTRLSSERSEHDELLDETPGEDHASAHNDDGNDRLGELD